MNLGFKNDFKVESGILIFLNCLGLVINIFICEEGPSSTIQTQRRLEPSGGCQRELGGVVGVV